MNAGQLARDQAPLAPGARIWARRDAAALPGRAAAAPQFIVTGPASDSVTAVTARGARRAP